jgi:hypothetical protein
MMAQLLYLTYQANKTKDAPEVSIESFLLTKPEESLEQPRRRAPQMPSGRQLEAYFLSLPGARRRG